MLVSIGLLSMLMLVSGLVVLTWFGSPGLYLILPACFMLLCVTVAIFLEVRIRERDRLAEAEHDLQERLNRIAELKKAALIRKQPDVAPKARLPNPASVPVEQETKSPQIDRSAENTAARDSVEVRLLRGLRGIDLHQVVTECGIALKRPSRIDFSIARRRTPGGPTVSVSFDLSRKWLSRLPQRQQLDLLIKLEKAVFDNLFSHENSDSQLAGDRVGNVCISGWVKVKRDPAASTTAARLTRECLIVISGPLKQWRQYGAEVCSGPDANNPRTGLAVRWAGGEPVQPCSCRDAVELGVDSETSDLSVI